MNYEQKYKDALERAKEICVAFPLSKSTRNTCETIFPELRESEDERIRGAIIDHLKDNNLTEWAAWLEKQGEPKPADKVEPKFHKDEWITNGDYTWKIVEVKPLDYILQSQDGNIVDDTISHVDEQFHSFTIEDAKDGDILVSQYGTPFIYNDNRDSILIGSYCGISVDGNFRVATEKCHWTENMNIHPAIKEQRNTLMEAMADAGYEFDFEKKELKKIEDEIEIPFAAKDSGLQEATYYIPKGFHAEIDDDKVVIKKGEKPTDEEMKELLRTEYEKGRADAIAETQVAWSEEDSVRLQRIIDFLWHNRKGDTDTIYQQEQDIDWLKSLKPQPKQEWSEEDEKMLGKCIDAASGYYDPKEKDSMKLWLESLRTYITNKQ